MLAADVTAAATLVAALATELTALGLLTDPTAIAAQTVVVLNAGNAARFACATLAGELGVQRQANAKAALAALLDYARVPAPSKPLEQYAFTVDKTCSPVGF